jgi:hypothetical protein
VSTSSGMRRRPLAASRRRSSISAMSRPPPLSPSVVPIGPGEFFPGLNFGQNRMREG